MNPESICCSLEIAKVLEEAGWNKKTVFVWLYQCDGSYQLWPIEHISYKLDDMDAFYYAPTSSEIDLPDKFSIHIKNGKYWVTRIMPFVDDHLLDSYPESRSYDIEVEARAMMWLYLKEKGLI